MEEEPEPFSEGNESEDKVDAFDDFIEVPEVVKLPESSSSPEMIGLEDQDEEEDVEEPPAVSKDEGIGNLERVSE